MYNEVITELTCSKIMMMLLCEHNNGKGSSVPKLPIWVAMLIEHFIPVIIAISGG